LPDDHPGRAPTGVAPVQRRGPAGATPPPASRTPRWNPRSNRTTSLSAASASTATSGLTWLRHPCFSAATFLDARPRHGWS